MVRDEYHQAFLYGADLNQSRQNGYGKMEHLNKRVSRSPVDVEVEVFSIPHVAMFRILRQKA